jgi:hypothetical protein
MKNVVIALTVGYVLGAKTAGKEFEQLNRSVAALFGTDEFAEVVASTRAQVGGTLRELASMVEGSPISFGASHDIVERVRGLVGHD